MAEDLASYCVAAARHFWGEPNPHHSTKTTLRWGTHGARKVDVDAGVWHDHSAGEGGGTLDLIRREAHLEGKEAIAWLRETLGADLGASEVKQAAQAPPKARIIATFDYVDEMGELLFQVVRFDPKKFLQRRRDPSAKDGWTYKVQGVRQVLYRLPDVIEAVAMGRTVYLVEGEKHADALWALGVPATTAPGGAGKWPESANDTLSGADVVILPDNDDPGRKHEVKVRAALESVTERLLTLELPDLPLKGDVMDWLAAGGTAESLYALVDEARGQATRFRSRFGAITWRDLDRQPAARDWLIDDLIYRNDWGLMYGASQSGKSFLAADASLAIARGVPFIGKKTRQGGVIYQAGEGGLGLVPRLRAYRQAKDIPNDADLPFILLPAKVDLFTRDGDADRFIEEIEGLRPSLSAPLELVVIDTFSTASPGANENASEDMSRVLANIERIKTQCRCAVLVVHHMNAAGERPRGHSSLYANADSAFEVSRDKEVPSQRRMKVAKVKDGGDGAEIAFQLQNVILGFREDGKKITSCVVVHEEDEDTPLFDKERDKQKPRLPLTAAQALFLKVLKRTITDHGRIAPAAVPTESPYTRVIEWPQFKAQYERAVTADKTPDSIRKQLERDGDALMKKDLIGRDNPFIWLTTEGFRHA